MLIHTRPTTLTCRPQGAFDLAAAGRFLEGWPPTRAEGAGGADTGGRASLRWATCLERSWEPIEVVVVERDGRLDCEVRGTPDREAVREHVARVLSIDVDGTGLADAGRRDRVAGSLLAADPGLRPVCFWTPYEAAVWGVLSQRSSMAQASCLKRRMAAELGEVAGHGHAFPAPERLAALDVFPGVPPVKVGRLRAVAAAALDGRLDAARLRSLDVPEALAELRRIPGVGPFTAELVLVRGAGHPDVFPRHERRLHGAMRSAYGRPDATVEELAGVADGWAPYRSWVSFLFRVDAARAPGGGAQPGSVT